MSVARKRKALSLDEKLSILDAVSNGEKKKDIASRYCIPPSTLSTILKAKDNLLKAASSGACSGKRMKLKAATFEDVDKAVFKWFTDIRARNIPVSGAVIQQKAKDFACLLGRDDFKASTGWLQKFKTRHMIVGKTASGESSAADTQGASAWTRDSLPDILAAYDPRDIYNADETGLFFQMLPKKTLAHKGDRCHGGKQSKLRLTILLCTNMDGSDKRIPLVIGKSERPRSFKKAARIPVKYTANVKAWMTRTIFVQWLQDFNADMKKGDRNVCLLVDNCSAHHVGDLRLSNVDLRFFPANCTSLIQPLDQGIINSLKCAYRHRVIDRLLLNLRLNLPTKVEVSHAVEMVAAAWQSTASTTIVNCFRKAGFAAVDDAAAVEDVPEAPPAFVSAWENLQQREDAVPAGVGLSDFLAVDDCLVATEEMNDDEIIDSLRDASESDSDPEEEPQPTAAEVLTALDTLRRYASALDNQEKAVEAVSVYERCVLPTLQRTVQTKLTNFFMPS